VGVWLVLAGVFGLACAWYMRGVPCVPCGCSCRGAHMGGVFLVKKKGVVAWLEGPKDF